MESRLYMKLTIANRVKDLRIARGWTQEQLAQAAGVSRQSINSIERNRYVPSLELALTFARVFDCPTDEIFQLENPNMTHPVLNRIPFFGKFVDERFLEHRRRSTSLMGIVGALIAVVLFEYRFFHDRFISWDLLAVLASMVAVKMGLMLWYRFNG